jgi:hypothetical protein
MARSVRTQTTLVASALLFVFGCSASKHPVLYPNDHLKEVGQAQAEADIATCRELAKQYSSGNLQGQEMAKDAAKGGAIGAAGGAVGGAIAGSPGEGAAIGAAAGATTSMLGSLFRGSEPSGAYMNWIDHCLAEKGYQPVGWE